VGEGGLQTQGDPPTGELLADRVVFTSDGDRAGGVDGALDLYGCAGGELRPGRSGRRRAGGPGALGAEPGEVDVGQTGGQGLEMLAVEA
jgi:hypothetical protein